MTQYAAVLIPTVNRINHLRTTIESLKKCLLADCTDVYVGLDYPPSEKYLNGYDEVCAYLEEGDFSVFHSFQVKKREENYGIAKNNADLRATAELFHDTFITMQDDIEVSKNFLVYINSALKYYENDPDVIAVSGYSYPVQWRKTDGSNALLTNYVAAEWGIGFWKKKRDDLLNELSNDYLYNNFIPAYKNGKLDLMIDACVKDYANTILNVYYREDSLMRVVCDISMRAYLPIANKYVVMPTFSHTRNHGFDGTGVYCGKIETEKKDNRYADTYDYDIQPIDNSDHYVFTPSKDNYIDENREKLNKFDRRDQKEMASIRRKLKRYAIAGSKLSTVYFKARSYYRAVKYKVKKAVR